MSTFQVSLVRIFSHQTENRESVVSPNAGKHGEHRKFSKYYDHGCSNLSI